MPLFPPQWLTSHAKVLSSVIVSLARGPLVTAVLERLGSANKYLGSTGELTLDQEECLMLVLYWVNEYQERRISPSDLLHTFAQLTSNLYKEV